MGPVQPACGQHWLARGRANAARGYARRNQRLEANRLRRPCPPIGRHRYFHKLYALDVVLPDLQKPNKKQLEEAMQGHIIAETQVMGTYQKGD